MHPWLSAWGQSIQVKDLAKPMAVAFVTNVTRFAGHLVTWKEARRRDDGLELVVFDLRTDAPPRPYVDIRREEPVGIAFGDDGSMPFILALREDFPDTEHQQLVPDGVPCALCVDDRPWVEARVTWTPIELLERLNLWFHRAARGELHDPHQPLDPFFGISEFTFIFPRSALNGIAATELAFFASTADANTLLSIPLNLVRGGLRFMTVAYRVAPERMTRLRKAPSTFGSLVRALQARNVDVVGDLRARMKEAVRRQAC